MPGRYGVLGLSFLPGRPDKSGLLPAVLVRISSKLELLLRSSSAELLCSSALGGAAKKIPQHCWGIFLGGSSQTRTGDTRLFRPLLYQLS